MESLVRNMLGLSTTGKKVNLDDFARQYADSFPELFKNGNPLIEPVPCERFISWVHAQLQTGWSFGGYLEDRSFLWAGSYLNNMNHPLHAGVDVNVLAGTSVHSPVAGKVLRIDDDTPENWGWGPRIFLEISTTEVLVLAHLQRIEVKPGDIVAKSQLVAQVGAPPLNGNWFPHLHLQLVNRDYFDRLVPDRVSELDGYFPADQLERFTALFPDPLGLLERAEKTFSTD